MQRGILVVLSGFSGAGKGTLMKRLLEKYSDDYALSVSVTTRKPREGEKEGISYFFRTEEEFQSLIDQDEFIEYARYVEHSYGTPRSYVEEKLDQGKDVILEIERQGALNVKKMRPDTLLLFVTPPSADELKRRLVARGTEDEETIAKRLNTACEEAQYIDQYDYLVINDDLEKCVDELHELIRAQHNQVTHQHDMIEKLKEDLLRFRKEN